MAATAAFFAGTGTSIGAGAAVGLGVAAGTVAASAIGGGGTSAPLLIEAPKAQDPKATAKADAASAAQRRRTAGAVGRSDTILTGGKGLGEVSSENLSRKTLLGY